MRRRTAEGADTADDPADKRRRTDLPLLPNVLAFIPSFSMELYNYQPIRGSSWIPTPSKLAGKRAIINVKNLKDEKCIIYSILASTRATDIKRGRGSRASSYTPFIDDLNTSGLSYPTPINEIRRFETKNELTINVYTCDASTASISPLQKSKRCQDNPINLLLITDVKTELFHYVLITSLDQ